METLVNDIRYGLRSFFKRPSFSVIAIATLALGIGATTVIFSVVNVVLLRSLPYPQAERIVAIQELDQTGRRVQVTPANFLDWRAQNSVFEHLAAIHTRPANLSIGDQTERIDIAMVSANLFNVFSSQPQLGRMFIPADEQAGHPLVAVISDHLWQSRFSGDQQIVGKPITFDGLNYTVVGVAPRGFQYPDKTEAWIPPYRLVPTLNERMDGTQVRGFGFLSAVGLLKPGVSVDAAGTEMEVITARLRQQYPDTNNRRFNKTVSLHTHIVGDTRPLLWLLFGSVAFLLLIACANVANLLLASAAARHREIAIRVALGATRGRIVRQLLTESGLLAITGGAFGLLLSVWGVPLMTRLLPRDFPRLNDINLDWRVFAFTVVASALTGVLFGLFPSLQVSKADVHASLKEVGRSVAGSRRHMRLRNFLVVSEVALSVVLLVGAGLLFRSLIELQSVHSGFDAQQVLTARLSPAGTNYRRDADYIAFYNKVMERVAAVPGVSSVGLINTLPLDLGPTAGYRIEGRPPLTPDKWPGANYRTVSPDYFRAMNVPLVQGRSFTDRDTEQAPLVMIVNEALAKRDFPNENPVGKRLSIGDRDGQPIWWEIVGVAANVRSINLKEEPSAEFYLSSGQDSFRNMFMVIRSSVDPPSIAGAVRQATMEADKTAAVSDVKPMERIVSDAVVQPRFNMFLLALFSVIALILSAAGIYGVTAYSVAQRTHEFGIRMALGARVSDVLKMILGQGLFVISIGVAIGITASLVLTRFMKSLLFGVGTTDPTTFVAISVLLMLVALVACFVPARRATKVDPLVALRYE